MKRLMVIMLAAMVLLAFSGVALAGVGNEAPSGSHYNLNIIGMQNPKTQDMNCGNGHRIFVGLNKSGAKVTTRILLTSGDSFAVLDCNGTDDGWAEFQLPAPVTDPAQYENRNAPTRYDVYIRVPGNPKGATADIALCGGYFTDGLGTWVQVSCNTPLELPTDKGKKFKNVTKELLYLDGYGWIFTDALSYLWEYDSYGLKRVQIRFYPKDPV